MSRVSPPNGRSSLEDSIHSPTLDDLGPSENDDRFSLDLHDPLNPTLYPHTHPQQSTQPLHRRIITILLLILLWYTFSLLLSLYNKWMFAPNHLNFPFPLFVTSLHMIVQFVLSAITLWLLPQFRPKRLDWLTTRDYGYFHRNS
jgi:uncharacterized membrane protein (DUF485 family)